MTRQTTLPIQRLPTLRIALRPVDQWEQLVGRFLDDERTGIGVIPRSQIGGERFLLRLRRVCPPTRHFFHDRSPVLSVEALLNNQVKTVTHGTACGEKTLGLMIGSIGRLRRSRLGASLTCKEGEYKREQDEAPAEPCQQSALFCHASTRTRTESTPFHRNPPGFHGLAIG